MVELQDAAPFPGTFIVFEGGEGTGKSTQVAILVERLRQVGLDVVATREPGGSAISEKIRQLILEDSSAGMSPRCEALLFAAARAEHISSLIRPALERGAVVVSDRFVDSSIAYQGVGRALGQADIAGISSWATGGVAADLTIVLDLDPVLGLARAQDPNRLEAEGLGFHTQVRETLRSLAQADPRGHVLVPADQTSDRVSDEVWRAVKAALERRFQAEWTRQAELLASTRAMSNTEPRSTDPLDPNSEASFDPAGSSSRGSGPNGSGPDSSGPNGSRLEGPRLDGFGASGSGPDRCNPGRV